ncbi:hypothetical protein GJAV_G00103560 [Gymnothorax javanicus]|nr:hypothetical protein GJAV_G00103560 [Gymnothorax javanicus]
MAFSHTSLSLCTHSLPCSPAHRILQSVDGSTLHCQLKVTTANTDSVTFGSSMCSGMGRSKSSARRIFWETVVLLGVLAVTSEGKIQRPDYDDTSTPEFLNASWMASIPDGRPLSEVTLPGTHNTMAFYGGALVECQSWSLDLQLQAGVRFLDIRVRHVNGTLTIHHGVVYQRAHLERC